MNNLIEGNPLNQYSMPESKISPLWDHQKQAIGAAKDLPNYALFHEPGCGKSRSVLSILLAKFEKDLNYSQTKKFYNTLILAPIVILEQWKREWEKYSDINPNYILVLTGTGQKKNRAVSEARNYINLGQSRIIISNYEALYNHGLYDFFLSFAQVLVCDESSRLKCPKAKRTKLVTAISDQCRHRYLLSGTPVLNSQLDIFSQFRILDGGVTFGKNFFAFRAKYFHDKNAGWKGGQNYFPDWRPKESANAEIRELIRPISSRVTKEECMDLPPLVREEIFVELTPPQRKTYNEMKETLITFLNDKACVAQMALTKCIRLQQMVSGFMKFDDGSERSFQDFAKLTALKDLLEDIAPYHKVIIWCIYKRNYEDIRKVCAELGLGYAELHGEVLDKDEQVQRFQTDITTRVMIANPAAGGLGVNLTSASYSIFYSRSFSLEADLQSESRNHRGGSKEAGHSKITRIDLIAKDTIDNDITFALKNKLATASEILDLLRKRIK